MKCDKCGTKMQFTGIKEIETGLINVYECPVCGQNAHGIAKPIIVLAAVLAVVCLIMILVI